jgi:periplasmic protein TonB
LSIERLPQLMLPAPLPPLPAAPSAVEVVATEIIRTATAVINTYPTFMQPSSIPTRVAMITDPPVEIGPVGSPDGVVGMPRDLYTNTTTAITRTAPPPPPQPTVEKDKPVTAEPTRIRLGGIVLEGKLVNRVMPEYPPLAVRARIQGTVRLMGVVGRDGHVRELKTIDGHPLLIPAALAAVRQWVYSPTLLNGEAVEVMAPIQVHFTLAR